MTAFALESTIAPPSTFLAAAELRVFWETTASLVLWPLLQRAPKGDGHAVLVLPGLVASDSSTALLRQYLCKQGYDARGWGLGQNLGLRAGLEADLVRTLSDLSESSGGPVSVVGWSLGGVYARLLAAQHPELIRSVVTLGSPFTGTPKATRAWKLYETVSGQSSDDPVRAAMVRETPTSPTTSIYSRSDGVVAWQCSVQETSDHSESIEVIGSHLGLGSHPAVLYALADRLAQSAGEWRPFQRTSATRWFYPDPSRAA